jgi:hypothetical protein
VATFVGLETANGGVFSIARNQSATLCTIVVNTPKNAKENKIRTTVANPLRSNCAILVAGGRHSSETKSDLAFAESIVKEVGEDAVRHRIVAAGRSGTNAGIIFGLVGVY